MPNAFQQLLNQLGRQAHLPGTPGNNPLVNFAMGQPIRLQDQTGSAELMPGGAFNIKGNKPTDFRATLNPMNQSVTFGKGIFDLTAGIGVNPLTGKTGPDVQLNFDTSLNKKEQAPVFLEQFLNPETTNTPVGPTEARAYADNEINKIRALNPYSYVMDRLDRRF